MATKKIDEGATTSGNLSGGLYYPYNSRTDGVSAEDHTYTPMLLASTTPGSGGGSGGGVGSVSYNAATGQLVINNIGGGSVTTIIPNGTNGDVGGVSYDQATGVLTITRVDGTTYTTTIPAGGVPSTDAGNDLTTGTDGKLYFAETITSMTYDAATSTLTYTNEAGTVVPINLSALASDIYISGGTFAGTTLTLTSSDPGVAPITVDLASFASTLVANGDGTYTHTSGDGTAVIIDTRDGISANAGNDLTLGTDGKPYIDVAAAETLTSLTWNAATSQMTYTDEAGVATNIDLAAVTGDTFVTSAVLSGTILTLADNNAGTPNVAVDLASLAASLKSTITNNGDGTYTHTASDGTTATIDTRDGISADANNFLLLGSDGKPYLAQSSVALAETTTVLNYNAAVGLMTYTDEDGNTAAYDLSQAGPDEVITQAGALSGAAPAGAQWGVDTTTGQMYYVSGGNWAPVPAVTTDISMTVSSQTGNTLQASPLAPPAGPDVGDVHLEVYDDALAWYVWGGAAWAQSATTPTGSGSPIAIANQTLTGNRVVNGGTAYSLTFDNITDLTAFANNMNYQLNTNARIQTDGGDIELYSGRDLKLSNGYSGVAVWPQDPPAVGEVLTVATYDSGFNLATLEWAPGGGDNIYTADGTLTGNRVVNGGGNSLDFFNNVTATFRSTQQTSVSGNVLILSGPALMMLESGGHVSSWPTSQPTIGKVLGVASANGGQYQLGWVDAGGANIYTADGTLNSNRIVNGAGTFDFELQNIDELNARANDIYFQGTNGVTLTSTSGPVSVLADTGLTLGNSTGQYSWPTTAPAVGDVLTVTSTGAGQHTMAWQAASGGDNIYTTDGTLTGTRVINAASNSIAWNNVDSFYIRATSQAELRSNNAARVYGNELVEFSASNATGNIMWSLRGEYSAYMPVTRPTSASQHFGIASLLGAQVNCGWVTGTTSDLNLKNVVGPISAEDSAAKIAALAPTQFTWKDSDDTAVHDGLIAQEVREILPSAVSGEGTEEAPYRVDYNEIIAHLIGAVKQLQDRVAELEAA